MEHHEWRPPPPPPAPLQAGTYPPPPMYYQGPRFSPPTPADYPRPDLYPAPGPHAPSPNDGWHPLPNYDHHVEGFPPRPRYDYGGFGSGINNGSNGYASEVDRSHKRPRVDDSGSGAFGFSSDDERRLKLIRDHGGGGSGGSGGNFANAMPPRPHGYHPHWGKAEPAAAGGSNNLYSPFQPTDGNLQWRNQGPQYPHWQEPPPPPPHSHLYGVGGSYGRPHYQSAGFISNFNEPGGGYTGPHEIRVSVAQPPVARPPLPPLPHPSPPPPPPPTEPPVDPSPPKLFPVPISSETTNPYHANASNGFANASNGFGVEEWRTSSRQYVGEGHNFLRKPASPEKPTFIDASHLFKQPYRATRPDHIVIILRGLPGSGKSYLAKMMRDLEVENGGSAPRIHSMDDYFMTEVEKVEKSDAAKSSSSARGKKPTVKRVLEYCYEPEMEEAYRESMLKSFKKTLEEGIFTVVIVDDRNLRVADFAQFWAIGKWLGYEVYISEASYKDPAGCAARNVHGFTLDEIQKMAGQWEEAPPLYLQLDMKSLSHGDDLKENGIQEVDMDTEDGDVDNDPSGMQERKPESAMAPSVEDDTLHEDGKRWDAEEDHLLEIKELGKSKWSDDIDDDDDTEGSEAVKGNLNALSGLLQSYRKQGKSVRWSDQVGNTGFSIGVARKAMSLVMGPGAGYNLKSNPLPEEESPTSTQSNAKSRKLGVFQERLRAERESFKSVFDRRKQRIGGLDLDDE